MLTRRLHSSHRPLFVKGFLSLLIDPTTNLIVIALVPTLADFFHVGLDLAAWWVTGYLVIYVALMPIAGVLGDRWGPNPVLLSGVTAFCLGTGVLTSAGSFGMFLAGRLLQGAGVACMLPVVLAQVANDVPTEHQGRMLGALELSGGMSGAGVLVAGALASLWGWRATFTLPLGLAVGVAVTALCSQAKSSTATTPVPMRDSFGLTMVLFPLVLALGAPRETSISWRIALLLLSMSLFGVGFSRRSHHADPSAAETLRRRMFRWAAISAGVVAFVMTTKIMVFPIYLARIWDIGPNEVVMLMLLNPVGMVLGNLSARTLVARWKPIWTAIAGTVVMFTGLGLLLIGIWAVDFVVVLFGFVGASFGGGFTSVGVLSRAVSDFPKGAPASSAGLFGSLRRSGTLLSAAISLPALEARLVRGGEASSAFLEIVSVLMLIVGSLLAVHMAARRGTSLVAAAAAK